MVDPAVSVCGLCHTLPTRTGPLTVLDGLDAALGTPVAAYERSLTELLDGLRQGGPVRVLVGRGTPPYAAAVDRAAAATGAEAVDLAGVGVPGGPEDHAPVAAAFADVLGEVR